MRTELLIAFTNRLLSCSLWRCTVRIPRNEGQGCSCFVFVARLRLTGTDAAALFSFHANFNTVLFLCCLTAGGLRERWHGGIPGGQTWQALLHWSQLQAPGWAHGHRRNHRVSRCFPYVKGRRQAGSWTFCRAYPQGAGLFHHLSTCQVLLESWGVNGWRRRRCGHSWKGERELRAGGIKEGNGLGMRSAWEVRSSEMEGIRKWKIILFPFVDDLADLVVLEKHKWVPQANICEANKDVAQCRWVVAFGHTQRTKNLLYFCTAYAHLFLIHVTRTFTKRQLHKSIFDSNAVRLIN